MKNGFGAHCDDFCVTGRLFLKLDLDPERETVLHFFERIGREYPALRRMRRRRGRSLILEEGDPDDILGESRRWIRLDPQSVRFGYFEPPSRQACRRFGQFLFDQAPAHLTLSHLDIDRLDVVYSFEMEYRGNHDRLVAETLFADHPMAQFLMGEEAAHTIDCQPYFGIALRPECEIQAYLEVKGRTSTFELRTGEFEPQLLSVQLTVRRYWGFSRPPELGAALVELLDAADELAARRAIPLVVNPLAQAIASRP
jgi:hypothetical protein